MSLLAAILEQALRDQELLDQAKKALFYGKDRPLLATFREEYEARAQAAGLAPVNYPPADMATGLERLHAAIGMRTEADEILRHELAILQGENRDVAVLEDELGDMAWYAQLYANAIWTTWPGVIRKNVAKLITRFKGLTFNAEKAKNPDKAAEAAAQSAA